MGEWVRSGMGRSGHMCIVKKTGREKREPERSTTYAGVSAPLLKDERKKGAP